MPFKHGKAAKLYANGWDLSAYLTKVGTVGKADVAEVSVLGTTDKSYLNGMMEGNLSADGFYSDGPNEVASVFGSAFSGTAPTCLFTHLPQGDTFGGVARGMPGAMSDFTIDSDTGGAGAVTIAATSTLGLRTGRILHPLGQESAPGNGTALDNGATLGATAAGLDSYLHVTQSSGGTLVVKVQHSTNNTDWTDLVTHTAVTASHKSEELSSLVAVPAGTVNRYLRTLWTLSAGTATFFHSIARLSTKH